MKAARPPPGQPNLKVPVVMPKKKEQTAESKPAKRTPSKKTEAKKPTTGSASPAAVRKRVSKKAPEKAAEAASEHPFQTPESSAPSHGGSGAEAHLSHVPEVTAEHVAVRAYFLAENRHAAGIPGDHASDWHEAETQLRAEAASIAASLKYRG